MTKKNSKVTEEDLINAEKQSVESAPMADLSFSTLQTEQLGFQKGRLLPLIETAALVSMPQKIDDSPNELVMELMTFLDKVDKPIITLESKLWTLDAKSSQTVLTFVVYLSSLLDEEYEELATLQKKALRQLRKR